MTFREMLIEIRTDYEMSQTDLAEALGYTAQYLCDLEKGRRLGSVEFVERLCKYFGHDPKGRRAWHVAAARSRGWDV